MEFELEGKIIEAPDGTDPQEVIDFLQGAGESILSVGSGLASSAAAGLEGIGRLATGEELDSVVAEMQKTMEAGTFQPRTTEGQAILHALGKVGETLEAPFKAAGDATLDATGSPGAATAVQIGGETLVGMLTGGLTAARLNAIRNSAIQQPKGPGKRQAGAAFVDVEAKFNEGVSAYEGQTTTFYRGVEDGTLLYAARNSPETGQHATASRSVAEGFARGKDKGENPRHGRVHSAEVQLEKGLPMPVDISDWSGDAVAKQLIQIKQGKGVKTADGVMPVKHISRYDDFSIEELNLVDKESTVIYQRLNAVKDPKMKAHLLDLEGVAVDVDNPKSLNKSFDQYVIGKSSQPMRKLMQRKGYDHVVYRNSARNERLQDGREDASVILLNDIKWDDGEFVKSKRRSDLEGAEALDKELRELKGAKAASLEKYDDGFYFDPDSGQNIRIVNGQIS